jgi:hypothetical protein
MSWVNWILGRHDYTKQVEAKREELKGVQADQVSAQEEAERTVRRTESLNRVLEATARALELAAEKQEQHANGRLPHDKEK